jgi:membrane protease YdiL (CAAX protease family)
MVRHVVLLGNDPSLATTLRTLLDPDDHLAEVDGVEGWQHTAQDEIDAVVVDLPSTVRLRAVEQVRRSYAGRLILLDPADDPAPVPAEYDCLVIKRPDLEALWNLTASGLGSATIPSEVADTGPTLDLDPALAPTSRRPVDHPTALEGQITDLDSIQSEEISAQRPVISDASQIGQSPSTAPLQEDGDPLQSLAVDIARRLPADVVALLLDNGEGVMEVFGGVGLTPLDWRLSVDYSIDVMRELSRTSITLIEDVNPVRQALVGIPGSQAKTLLMTMLVQDHDWIGVLIAGHRRSQAGVAAQAFTDDDVRTLIAIADTASPSLHTVVLLRRIECEFKAGNNSVPAGAGPGMVAEAERVDTAPALTSPPGPSSIQRAPAAHSAPSTQDAPAQAARSAGAADSGRATPLLLAYLSTLTVIELAGSSPLVSVPVAAASHGLLALLLCLALRMTRDQRLALLLPPLVAVSVVRLITLAALPGDVSPSIRLVVVGVPALVAIAMAARQRSPAWWLLQPHTGGWAGQLLVALVGIPSALFIWAIAPPAIQVRGDASMMLTAAVLLIFAALPEELLYRGLLVPAATDVVGGWGIPFAAAVYALAFLNGGSIRTVLLAFLLGMVLGWCREMTGSVVGVIGAHSVVNIMVFLLLPAPGI